MLADFISKALVMLLGYAYPAFECYKTMEKNRIEIEQLRFWCQYWVIVAILTVLERIGDALVSWLPMYGEMKLAFFIYLWYPKTRGTSYIYETILRPSIARHETRIDRKLPEWRDKAWDLAIQQLQNCTAYGQTTFYQVLQYFIAQSSGTISSSFQKDNPPPPPTDTASIHHQPPHKQSQRHRRSSPQQ